MPETLEIYVRMIEGTECSVPVKARKIADGQYEIVACAEFDCEDASLLMEYLPGDVVQVRQGKAIALLSAQQSEERTYWRFLFEVTDKGTPTSPITEAVVSRIAEEIEQGSRWHYPVVKEWIARNRNR